ncbi:MAG: TetR/AcrR family transcriptional regulator [Leptothrix sp. (in: b-proteobacteria)]
MSTSVPSGPTAPLSHQRRKAERPQELLAAALSLFVEKGFAATRAEEVAQRAGVSKGTLYLYYPSKEELLKAVIRQYLSSEIADGAAVAQSFTGSSADGLRLVLSQWWERVLASPASGVFKLIITEVRNFPEIAEFYHREVVQPGEQVIGQLLQRGIDAGEFRPINVAAAVHSIVLPMVMLCLHKHSLGMCQPVPTLAQPHEFIQQHFDLLLSGLQSRPAS